MWNNVKEGRSDGRWYKVERHENMKTEVLTLMENKNRTAAWHKEGRREEQWRWGRTGWSEEREGNIRSGSDAGGKTKDRIVRKKTWTRGRRRTRTYRNSGERFFYIVILPRSPIKRKREKKKREKNRATLLTRPLSGQRVTREAEKTMSPANWIDEKNKFTEKKEKNNTEGRRITNGDCSSGVAGTLKRTGWNNAIKKTMYMGNLP